MTPSYQIRALHVDDEPNPTQPKANRLFTERLQLFRINTNATCVLVLSHSGHVIDLAGDIGGLDISGISALIAANFMAGMELARLLGNGSIFKTSFHEGSNYNIYAHSIDDRFLLATIFGQKSKQGVIRFYANKLVEDLGPLLVDEMLPSMESLGAEFTEAVEIGLDKLFRPTINSRDSGRKY